MGRRVDLAVAAGERRRYRRFAEDVSVFLTTTAVRPNEFHSGRVRDVSLGGLCLWTSRAWEVGARLYLGIFWEGEPEPLVAVARVRRCVQEAAGFTSGLKFLLHTGQQRCAVERLRAHLADRYGEAAVKPRVPR
jgi:hypothetical protein